MAYLTYEEYQKFSFVNVDEESFDKLLMRATMAINSVTNFRLVRDENTISNLPDWMQKQFKQAVALQIEYIAKTGIETAADAREQNNISSSSIGDTTVSIGKSDTGSSDTSLYLSPDVMSILSALGLLYKGVPYVR